eukprot:2283386-Amphidinium_carterae.1
MSSSSLRLKLRTLASLRAQLYHCDTSLTKQRLGNPLEVRNSVRIDIVTHGSHLVKLKRFFLKKARQHEASAVRKSAKPLQRASKCALPFDGCPHSKDFVRFHRLLPRTFPRVFSDTCPLANKRRRW